MRKVRFKKFVAWIDERQAIYRRREAGRPPPWTDDAVMRRLHFCNVFRELDKTTAWLDERWYRPYGSDRAGTGRLPFLATVGRVVNHLPSLEAIGAPPVPWRRSRFVEALTRLRESGGTITSSAFTQFLGNTGDGTAVGFFTRVFDQAWRLRRGLVDPTSCQRTLNRLCQIHGIGRFRGNEVVTDLRYHTPLLDDATDRKTWTNVGPGAARGLNLLAGRERAARLSQPAALAELVDLRARVEAAVDGRDPMFERLTLRNVEDCLCEWDKYERGKAGLYRRRYRGG